ncbi:hypothetical protein AACG85_02240 [Escherichia coli]
MKLTEESLNLVIDILNDLICEGKMLNDVERRSLLNAVMAITAVKERSVVSVSSRKEQSKKEKKEREMILVSQMLVWHGMRQTRVYCEMFWRMYRTMKLVNTFSGWQRN